MNTAHDDAEQASTITASVPLECPLDDVTPARLAAARRDLFDRLARLIQKSGYDLDDVIVRFFLRIRIGRKEWEIEVTSFSETEVLRRRIARECSPGPAPSPAGPHIDALIARASVDPTFPGSYRSTES